MRVPYDPRLPLDGLNRRTFLTCSGVAAAGAILAGAAGCSWQDVQRQASQNPLPPGSPVLVLVTLYGGNDGLNTLVPYTDSAYHAARPGLAYEAGEVLSDAVAIALRSASPSSIEKTSKRSATCIAGAPS